jgi:alpha-L-fucosidase 2
MRLLSTPVLSTAVLMCVAPSFTRAAAPVVEVWSEGGASKAAPVVEVWSMDNNEFGRKQGQVVDISDIPDVGALQKLRDSRRQGTGHILGAAKAADSSASSVPLGSVSARLGESPFWFNTPAADWSSEIPIGNGKLGALVSGEPFCEVVHLSEDTMWAGRHASKPTPDSVNKRDPKHFAAFERAREAVLKEDWKGAEQATNAMVVDGISGFSYLGELRLTSAATDGKYEGFKRDLNLETAITSSTFQSQAVSHSREAFVSAADQVMVMQFSQDAGPLQIDVEMTSTHHVSSTGSSAGNFNVTTMTKKEDGGLVFTVCAAVLPSSDIINAVEAEGKLRITGSGRSSFALALAAVTSYGEHRDARCSSSAVL